jgi:hypothetical protein
MGRTESTDGTAILLSRVLVLSQDEVARLALSILSQETIGLSIQHFTFATFTATNLDS